LNYTEASLYTSLDNTLCPAAAKSSGQARNENRSAGVDPSSAEKGQAKDPVGDKRWAIMEGYIPEKLVF
jgi:hypothetical protein